MANAKPKVNEPRLQKTEPTLSTEVMNQKSRYSTTTSERSNARVYHSSVPTRGNQHVDKKSPKEINILILGETGVGKSTFINGLINYLTYKSLEQAEKSKKPVIVVPSTFTMCDEDFKEYTICSGKDKNEASKPGQSATQMPRTYSYKYGNLLLRFIDTPGIGDTRGVDQDNINFQYVMHHIARFTDLHGICILLKPNDGNLPLVFRLYIEELFKQLSRDACNNMIFCFTHSRATLFRPEKTFTALKALLVDAQLDKLLSKDNVYMMDNEAIKYLMALKFSTMKFSKDEKKNYSDSWHKSLTATVRMIKYIETLKPHDVRNSVSFCEVRSSVNSLSLPLAEICRVLMMNLDAVESKRSEIQSSSTNNSELYIPVIDLETSPVGCSQVVCTSTKCIRMSCPIGNVMSIEYATVCCNDCDIDAEKHQTGCAALQHCHAMQPSGKTCSTCQCPVDCHMQITFTTSLAYKILEDMTVRNLLQNASSSEAYARQNKLLIAHHKNIDCALDEILNTCSIFSAFLKLNSIGTIVDKFDEYFRMFAEAEHQYLADNTTGICARLCQRYNAYMPFIESGVQHETVNDGLLLRKKKDVHETILTLTKIHIVGPMLVQIMDAVENRRNEIDVSPSDEVETNEFMKTC